MAAFLLCGAGLAQAFPGSGAFPTSPGQRAQAFAYCAGAYLAVAEHRGSLDGTVQDRAMDRRALFADMLDAVTPDAIAFGTPSGQITALRVQARADLRRLLAMSEFNMTPERAQPARQAAEQTIARCNALLLGT